MSMPDEEKNPVDQEEVETEGADKKGLPLKKYGIYAGIVIVMVAAAYFVTLKVVKPMFAGKGTTVEEKAEEKPEPEHKSEGGHGASAEGHSEGGEASNVFMIDNIVVNPAGTGGRRFLSAAVGLEVADADVSGLLEQRKAIVRDALITILSSQSIPELSDFKQREKLRKLIKLRVEKLLKTDGIEAVYFTEFVLQ
jgi:flagellar FliL protein